MAVIIEAVLVRHARPAMDPKLPRGQWALSDEGRAGASELGAKLAQGSSSFRVMSSNETKAVETAALIGQAIGERRRPSIDVRFREVEHPWIELGRPEKVLAYLEGDQHEGWEPATDVVGRVRAGIDSLPGKDLPLVVTHGIAMSLFVASVAPDIAASEFWAALEMPDAWRLDLSSGAMTRLR